MLPISVVFAQRRCGNTDQRKGTPVGNNDDRLASARDIATHAVDKSSDNVNHGTGIARGDIAGGIGGIVKNSIDIATHSVDKTKEMITGTRDDAEDRKAGRE
jgi:hypothetical protein